MFACFRSLALLVRLLTRSPVRLVACSLDCSLYSSLAYTLAFPLEHAAAEAAAATTRATENVFVFRHGSEFCGPNFCGYLLRMFVRKCHKTHRSIRTYLVVRHTRAYVPVAGFLQASVCCLLRRTILHRSDFRATRAQFFSSFFFRRVFVFPCLKRKANAGLL